MAIYSEAAKQKATQVWSRLLDCFGDSVLRKFGAEPPGEWITAVGFLKPQQIDRAFRRMQFQGMTGVPSLPAFMHLARAVGEDDGDAPPPLPLLVGPEMDAWEGEANRRFLVYVRNEIAAKPARYGTAASYSLLHLPKEQVPKDLDCRYLDASPAFKRNIALLVTAKKAWAADMRDLATNDSQGRVPQDLALAVWDDYFQTAVSQMAERPPEATSGPA